MKKNSLSGNDINSSPPLSNSLESFRFKDEDNYDVRFWLKVYLRILKI